MFTGIIETIGEVVDYKKDGSNIHYYLKSDISNMLKIDQSLAHNGVCLTVVNIDADLYQVTAIKETLEKSNLKFLEIGSKVNLERSMKMGGRIDGHFVQGHVDQTAICTNIQKQDGSHLFTFKYKNTNNITVEKGSISVNGVSLTVVNSNDDSFSVAVIPYTFENTNFNLIKKGEVINLEFDILGKYILKQFNK